MQRDGKVAPVSISVGDVLSVKAAAEQAGVAETTVTRWASRYGIGRQLAPHTAWRISEPALRMVLAMDREALDAFRARHFDSPAVRKYLGSGAGGA